MKKKIVVVVAVILVLVLLSAVLTGCLKIGLKKNNVVRRLTEEGYDLVYGRPALGLDEEIMKSIELDDSFTASKISTEGETTSRFLIYVYYCADTDSADRLEKMIQDKKMPNPDNAEEEISLIDYLKKSVEKNVSLYRNDDVIMLGDFESVSTARNY